MSELYLSTRGRVLSVWGRVENIFGKGRDFPDEITHDGVKYHKSGEDFQFVKELVFGDPALAEGECFFADYENEENDAGISLGLLCRNGERADVILNPIQLEEIEVL